MCPKNTGSRFSALLARGVLTLSILVAGTAFGQVAKLDWRQIGNSALDYSLSAVGTGSFDRVWYSPDGATLFARTASGHVFSTSDLETWAELSSQTEPPVPSTRSTQRLPESTASTRAGATAGPKVYAVGRFAYRSDDDGLNWSNLTGYKNTSLLGEGLADLAVSPRDPNEIAVAANTGVWRSVDGGLSWTGLNSALPNLEVRRILGVPSGVQGARIAAGTAAAPGSWEWMPGEKQSWHPSDVADLKLEGDLKKALSIRLHASITAISSSGDYFYIGSADGQIWSSANAGRSWTKGPDVYSGSVERIWIDGREPRVAVAVLGNTNAASLPNAKTAQVLRTINGGGFWDDLTSDLPDGPVHGVAADRATGAIYVATGRGLFMTFGDLVNAGPATAWISISEGLPAAPAADVALDPPGNQLYVALEGYGLYATAAPHRARNPQIVSAADLRARPAAPGALLTVLGASTGAVRAGVNPAAVLATGDSKTEIQVPFDVTGTSLPVSFDSSSGTTTLGISLKSVSPAIFVDRDGTPMLLDGDSGVLLDAMTAAHSDSRVQILATGLGRVRPDWPAGVAAPASNSPRVIAPVRAFLDREPVEVTRAILAPGYVGFYLIEITLPKIVNYGPAELYIEADGQASNRVRLYIEP